MEERYDPAEAVRVLDERAAGLAEVPAVAQTGFAPEPAQDLSPHYFGGPSPDCHDLQVPEGHDGECGGRCIGMVGGALVFEQGARLRRVREGVGVHEVELLVDEVVCEYDFEPQQFSLF